MRKNDRNPRPVHLCERCGSTWTTRPHDSDACITALRRRNARERDRINDVSTQIGEAANQISRFSQRLDASELQAQSRLAAFQRLEEQLERLTNRVEAMSLAMLRLSQSMDSSSPERAERAGRL